MTDVSHRFSLSQIDHHELLEILTLRYGTCWRVSEHEISFPASPDYRLQLKMRHGQIKKISAGESITKQTFSVAIDRLGGFFDIVHLTVLAESRLRAHMDRVGGPPKNWRVTLGNS
jgi:hypothetical protein